MKLEIRDSYFRGNRSGVAKPWTKDRETAEEFSMFIELQATYFVLKRWKQDCVATRKQIGIWSEWKQETEDNDRPLSKDEAERMKAFLRRSAQTSYFELFVEERADW